MTASEALHDARPVKDALRAREAEVARYRRTLEAIRVGAADQLTKGDIHLIARHVLMTLDGEASDISNPELRGQRIRATPLVVR